MSFAAPLFLLTALAALIPLLLHLFYRQPAKELPFPTLRFLKLSMEKTRRRKRIHDLLLLLLRSAALLLTALGLARPAITLTGALWGARQTAVAIILDNSASMGVIDGDSPRLETARTAAAQILDQLAAGDSAALLPTCGRPFPDAEKLHRNQGLLRRMLQQCTVSYQRADLPAALLKAKKLLDEAEAPNKQIFLLTDMQQVSWKSLADQPPSDGPSQTTPLIVVDCSRAPKPNAALQLVEMSRSVPVVGWASQAVITLWNTSEAAQTRRVELVLNGRLEAAGPEIVLPPLSKEKYIFNFTFRQGGLQQGLFRLAGEDGSRYDDGRYFAVEVGQELPIAVVHAERHEIPYLDDTFYLEKALSVGLESLGAVRMTRVPVKNLAAEPLEKYQVLYCVNLPALDSQAAERLRSYLHSGGKVVWLCGENVRPADYNRMNDSSNGELLPAKLSEVRAVVGRSDRDSWHISFLDERHPALKDFLQPPALYLSVLVYKHVAFSVAENAAAQTRVLAGLDDGQPLIVERNVGPGKVLFVGTSLQTNWTNLPLRPLFMPLIGRLTFYLTELEDRCRELTAGAPILLPRSIIQQAESVEVVSPGGETLRFQLAQNGSTDQAAAGDKQKQGGDFRYPDTYQIGVYAIRLQGDAGQKQFAFAVNFDPEEIDPAKLERSELLQRWGKTVIFAEDPNNLAATFAMLREGHGLWEWFLSAVLITLVLETLIANRFGAKKSPQ